MLGGIRYFLQCRRPCKFGKRLLAQFSTEADSAQARTEPARVNQGFKFRDSIINAHPHLLSEGELMPGIRLEEFQKRRNDLVQRILSFNSPEIKRCDHIVIIPAATKAYMSENIPYVFRQNSNFLYFTGCKEPDALLVITTKNENVHSTLFVKEVDERTEIWEGSRTNASIAPSMFGVNQALTLAEFEPFFRSFINECNNCHVWYDSNSVIQPVLNRKLCDLMQEGDKKQFLRPTNLIHNLRLIKSEGEINLMKKSCNIISKAITKTIEVSRPNVNEHELFATVDYEARMNGAQYLAYPPVVAGGSNATIIHYINNDQVVPENKVVLMDAGCDYYGYSSDVTRSWPISGTFTQEQRLLYEVVLETQTILIQKLANMSTLDDLFVDMNILLGRGLQEIGLIPKSVSGSKFMQATYQYCPHHVSHYLGMDVHDTGNIQRNIKLQPGMIVTVEPGIYVSPRNRDAPAQFHGIGIRIEDDVLITENGPVILSDKCPKSISDIEQLASRNQ